MHHRAWLIFVLLLLLLFVETEFGHIAQACLKFLSLSDPPVLASQSAGITAVSHYLLPALCFEHGSSLWNIC